MTLLKITFALLLCLWFGCLSTVFAEDWPQWRGLRANGISAEEIASSWPAGSPRQLWKAEVGTGFSACVVANGLLVTMGNRDQQDIITCLNAETGVLQWTYQYAADVDPNLFEGGPTATPTIAAGRVYTLSRQGRVCCLELASGKVVWEKQIREELKANVPEWGFSGSPVMTTPGLLLNMGSHGVLLNAADGTVQWNSDNSDDAGYATPVLLPETEPQLALVMSGKSLNAVEVASGEIAWQTRWITRYGVNAADPQLVPEGIFLSSGYGKGTTLLKLPVIGTEPEAIYRSRDLRNQMSPGVIIDGYIYAPDGDAGTNPPFHCLEVATGKLKWSHAGLGSATLIAAGEQLIILSDQGKLVLAQASAEQFLPLAEAQVIDGKCWTLPTLANGRLYCRNAVGTLVCLDMK